MDPSRFARRAADRAGSCRPKKSGARVCRSVRSSLRPKRRARRLSIDRRRQDFRKSFISRRERRRERRADRSERSEYCLREFVGIARRAVGEWRLQRRWRRDFQINRRWQDLATINKRSSIRNRAGQSRDRPEQTINLVRDGPDKNDRETLSIGRRRRNVERNNR